MFIFISSLLVVNHLFFFYTRHGYLENVMKFQMKFLEKLTEIRYRLLGKTNPKVIVCFDFLSGGKVFILSYIFQTATSLERWHQILNHFLLPARVSSSTPSKLDI